jgi:hypothetical protein
MKHTRLFVVLLMGFALVNGFSQANEVGQDNGVGPVSYDEFDELKQTVIMIQDIGENALKILDTQGDKINEILDWIAGQRDEKPSPQDIVAAPEDTTPEQITQPGIKIIDNGRLNQNTVVNFIQYYSRLPRPEIESIVTIYILEAKKEQVNHDIAIAQMCYATQFLNNRTLLIARNYAGLHDASFSDKTIGIRAHIQHLKGYATCDEVLSEEIVDPRFYMPGFIRVRGTITMFDELFFSTWSPENASNYGRSLMNILDGLYQYANMEVN